jgi:hypothetical protein
LGGLQIRCLLINTYSEPKPYRSVQMEILNLALRLPRLHPTCFVNSTFEIQRNLLLIAVSIIPVNNWVMLSPFVAPVSPSDSRPSWNAEGLACKRIGLPVVSSAYVLGLVVINDRWHAAVRWRVNSLLSISEFCRESYIISVIIS